MRSHEEHRREAAFPLKFSILTVSTSRYENRDQKDVTGDVAEEILRKSGNEVVERDICPDDPAMIRNAVMRMIEKSDVVVVCGGTGIHPQDLTVEAVKPIFEREITGFGEIFRFLSYAEIGPAAMLSRATAGVVKKTIVYLLPGSPDAVKLALEKIIIPESAHAVWTARGYSKRRN
ncbi:MAG: MogA/MoaB family molybdenum cofactor biosynthesis protein [Candidatus Methanodesulfokora sp.]